MPDDPYFITRWEGLRDSTRRRLELMREGRMHTYEGKTDTTDVSIRHAEQQLEAIEQLLADHRDA